MNSPTNPAAPGSAITIFMAGEGQYTLTDGYAVVSQPSALFIDGFYCNGIAAKVGPVDGLPGNVYQLSVFVPDPVVLVQNNPDLKNFRFPSQSFIQIWMGPTTFPMLSQSGVLSNHVGERRHSALRSVAILLPPEQPLFADESAGCLLRHNR